MGEHRPEAAEGFGGNAASEHRDVALEIGPDEVLPPAPAQPVGETLARLLHQIERCRSEQQEASRPKPLGPPAIDQPAQVLEQFRRAMNFVEDDELVLMAAEKEFGFGQVCAIGFRFEIEIDRRPLPADLLRQCRLADLAGSEQRDGRGAVEPPSVSSAVRRRSIILAFMEFGSRFARLFWARYHGRLVARRHPTDSSPLFSCFGGKSTPDREPRRYVSPSILDRIENGPGQRNASLRKPSHFGDGVVVPASVHPGIDDPLDQNAGSPLNSMHFREQCIFLFTRHHMTSIAIKIGMTARIRECLQPSSNRIRSRDAACTAVMRAIWRRFPTVEGDAAILR